MSPWRRFSFRLSNLFRKLHNEEEFFFLSKYFLAASGIFLTSRKTWLRIAWNLYRIILAMHYTLITYRFVLTVQDWASFGRIIKGFQIYFGCTIIHVRALIIGYNFEAYLRVNQFINGKKMLKDDHAAVKIRQLNYEHICRVTWIFVGNVLFQSLVFPLSTMPDAEPLRLPLDLSDMSPIGRKICEEVFTLFWVPFPYLASANFLIIYVSMCGILGEFEVVLSSFRMVLDQVDESAAKDPIFWKNTQRELNDCINDHIVVLTELKAFERLTKWSFLLIYYMTMLFISVGALVLIWNPMFDVYFVMVFDYIARYVAECYVFCRLVTTLNETNAKLSQMMYQFEWPETMQLSRNYSHQQKSIRATILMVMARSQRSLGISSGGMFELKLEKFTSLINMSYSLAMFLWNVKNLTERNASREEWRG